MEFCAQNELVIRSPCGKVKEQIDHIVTVKKFRHSLLIGANVKLKLAKNVQQPRSRQKMYNMQRLQADDVIR